MLYQLSYTPAVTLPTELRALIVSTPPESGTYVRRVATCPVCPHLRDAILSRHLLDDGSGLHRTKESVVAIIALNLIVGHNLDAVYLALVHA